MWEINEALAGVWEITISSEKESHTGAVGSQGAQSKHRKMITAIILFRRRKCHYYGRTVIFEFLDCNRAGGQEAEEEEKEEKLGKAEDAHGPALDWAVEVGILVTASFTRCCFCFFLLLTSICSIGEKKTHTEGFLALMIEIQLSVKHHSTAFTWNYLLSGFCTNWFYPRAHHTRSLRLRAPLEDPLDSAWNLGCNEDINISSPGSPTLLGKCWTHTKKHHRIHSICSMSLSNIAAEMLTNGCLCTLQPYEATV